MSKLLEKKIKMVNGLYQDHIKEIHESLIGNMYDHLMYVLQGETYEYTLHAFLFKSYCETHFLEKLSFIRSSVNSLISSTKNKTSSYPKML